MLAAKLPFRFIPELNRGEAVYWDITNRSLVDNGVPDVSLTTPEAAGRNLARLGREHHFTLFECFLSDIIGHKRDLNRAVDFLEMLDRFLGAVLDEAGQDVHVLISSDHGNLEDLETGGHTRNDVPLIVFGPRAGQMAGVRSIVNIPETLLSRFWA
ncbi:MAG: phosphoglyceromutase, partial [Verrucomicrobiota bacterium]